MSGCSQGSSDDVIAANCPRTEDFHAETELPLDLIEGCRVFFSKSWPASDQSKQFVLTQAVNMGTYSGFKSQQALLQSLLVPESIKRGGHQCSTVVQYASSKPVGVNCASKSKFSIPGEKSFLGRFASCNKQWTMRGHWKLSNFNLSAVWFTGQPFAPFRKYLPTSLLDSVLVDNPLASEDISMVRLERETPASHVGVKLSMQPGTPVVGLTYSLRSLVRQAWAGLDWSYFPTSGALMTTVAVKQKLSDSLACTASLASEPNFEKPMTEGIVERVYKNRWSAIYKYSNNLSLVANAQMKFGPTDPLFENRLAVKGDLMPENVRLYSREALLKRLSGFTRLSGLVLSCGYDVTFTKIRAMAEINTQGQLKTVVHTADGMVYSGQIDWPDDNYKFGFGYEVAI